MHQCANKDNADQEYRDLQKYLKTYSRKTLWNIFWSANNYKVPYPAPEIDAKIQFWVGTDERKSRLRDLKWYQNYLPQLEQVQIPKMMHGEFVMMHPEGLVAAIPGCVFRSRFDCRFMYQHSLKASDEMRRLHEQFYEYMENA